MDSNNESNDDPESSDDEPDPDRLFGLPGVPGEARAQMLTDEILQQAERLRTDRLDQKALESMVKEIDDAEYEEQEAELEEAGYDEDEVELPLAPPVHRLTFIFSATLTMSDQAQGEVGDLSAKILKKAGAKGLTKVVDLTTKARKTGKMSKAAKKVSLERRVSQAQTSRCDEFQLPPGLTLQQIRCTQKHKDSHLYAYLVTTSEGSSGPSLVFCNSIAAVRRVGATLQALGLQVRILHAHMQQVRKLFRTLYPAMMILQMS
jgi:ATP-dependent RNA helicase DDX24/MAK5